MEILFLCLRAVTAVVNMSRNGRAGRQTDEEAFQDPSTKLAQKWWNRKMHRGCGLPHG